jgi:hypothetical protein
MISMQPLLPKSRLECANLPMCFPFRFPAAIEEQERSATQPVVFVVSPLSAVGQSRQNLASHQKKRFLEFNNSTVTSMLRRGAELVSTIERGRHISRRLPPENASPNRKS